VNRRVLTNFNWCCVFGLVAGLSGCRLRDSVESTAVSRTRENTVGHMTAVWSESDEIPILAGRYHLSSSLPVSMPGVTPFFGHWERSKSEPEPDPKRFATAGDATAATKEWLSSHFGAFTPPVTLDFTSNGYDKGNTIEFTEIYAGLPTGIRGWVEFRGRTPVWAQVGLYELDPIPGSAKNIINSKQALATWKQAATNAGSSLTAILNQEKDRLLGTPRLVFSQSSKTSKLEINGKTYVHVFNPTWVLDERRKLNVNAHTGTPWFESDSNNFIPTPVPKVEALPALPPRGGEPLPLLSCRGLKPILEDDEFTHRDGLSFDFPKKLNLKPPTEEPFSTDAEAVSAAVEWVVHHFGPIPPRTSIEVTRVLHSSSGSEKPRYSWDRGHTITLHQFYDKIPTEIGSVIYITGRTRFSGHVEMATIEPVRGSARKLVTKEAAVKAWRTTGAGRGATKEELDKFEKRLKPRIEYVWSPTRNADLDDGPQIYAPTWVMIEGEPLMVDGHTGKPWVND
jgi:hypothetical protein